MKEIRLVGYEDDSETSRTQLAQRAPELHRRWLRT